MKFIDLTREISEDCIVYPKQPDISLKLYYNLHRDGRNLEKISMSSHFGTHIDAPFHFLNDGKAVDQIDLEKLCGKAFLLHFRKKMGSLIDIDDIKNSIDIFKRYERIIIKTDWDKEGHEYYRDYPVLSYKAAEMIANSNISLLGMDTPSPGPSGKDGEDIHKLLLSNNIIILEGLTNLERVEENPFNLICFPLKLKGVSGAPCRVVALK